MLNHDLDSDLILKIYDKIWALENRERRQAQNLIPVHAIKRAKERYNFDLTPRVIGCIVESIDRGLVALVGVDGACHRYHVLVDGFDICVVWNFRNRFIVSVLPNKLRRLRRKRR